MSDYVLVVPTVPTVRLMMSLRLHRSLIQGLVSEGALDLKEGVVPLRLTQWADNCERPAGQKADVARMLAYFGMVGGADIREETDASGKTFWDVVG